MIAYTLTPTSLNLYLDGRFRTLDNTHPNFTAVLDLLKDKHKAESTVKAVRDTYLRGLNSLLDITSFLAVKTEGRVKISEDAVLYDGKPVHGLVTKRLIEHLTAGFDVKPLMRFVDKLMRNPTTAVHNDLYNFLEASKLPICDDGDFIAYKYVREDYKSNYDGETDNSVGAKPSMPREECDDDRNNVCSRGLHFAAFNFVRGHARIVVLKVNPEHVVSIPNDYSNEKGRACTYEVIDEVDFEGNTKRVEPKLPPVVEEKGTYKKAPLKVKNKTPKATKTKSSHLPPVFTYTGQMWSPAPLLAEVKRLGQRGFSRQHGVPRSTLQGWIRSAEAWRQKKARKQ